MEDIRHRNKQDRLVFKYMLKSDNQRMYEYTKLADKMKIYKKKHGMQNEVNLETEAQKHFDMISSSSSNREMSKKHSNEDEDVEHFLETNYLKNEYIDENILTVEDQ